MDTDQKEGTIMYLSRLPTSIESLLECTRYYCSQGRLHFDELTGTL